MRCFENFNHKPWCFKKSQT